MTVRERIGRVEGLHWVGTLLAPVNVVDVLVLLHGVEGHTLIGVFLILLCVDSVRLAYGSTLPETLIQSVVRKRVHLLLLLLLLLPNITVIMRVGLSV